MGEAQFSSVKRFSYYAEELPALQARFGATLEQVLLPGEAILTSLHFIQFGRVWEATFAIRKSFSMAGHGASPLEACYAALTLAHEHADWLDSNPRRSANASRDPRIEPAPSGGVQLGATPARSGGLSAKALFNDLFKD